MHVQAVVNQKGGCGKTTTAIHVAASFARGGRRSLLVDLDPQGHATLGIGLASAYGEGIYEVLVGTHDLADVVVAGPVPGLSIVPASISLAAVESPGGIAGAYGPIPIAGGVMVRFRNPGAGEVKVAGSFNDWRPDENVLTYREDDGTWQKIVFLSPGSYEYRLVVDGDWEADPNNEAQVSNAFGGFNSVIHV